MFNKNKKSKQDEVIEEITGAAEAEAPKKEKKEIFKKIRSDKKTGLSKDELVKRFKYGSLSVILTVIVIAVIVIVNVLVGVVADKFPEMSIDTTVEQYYELSDASKDYLADLEEYEIEVIFIGSRSELMADTYYNKIITLAEKYQQAAPHLTVSCIDPDLNPGFESKYNNAEFKVGDAIVACGERYRHLNSADFLVEKTDGTEQSTTGEESASKEYSLNAEYGLTTAIMVVTASDNPVATIINGHGEYELPKLTHLLESNGFTVNTQSIVKELDYNSNLLIISAPTKDYSEEDLKKLDDFMYNGGKYGKNIMYVADYRQPALPNLEAFLYDWGVELEEGVVYESDDSIAYANMPYLNTLTFVDPDLALSTALTETTAYGFWGRPAKIADVLDVNMVNAVVLQHSETSKVGTLVDGAFKKGEGDGSYVAMSYTSIQKNDENLNLLESNLIFVNSTAFFEDQLFEKSYSANPDITISVVDASLGRENSIYIPTKSLSAAALGITYQQANWIGAIAAVGIPVILLVICLVVYIRRRYL